MTNGSAMDHRAYIAGYDIGAEINGGHGNVVANFARIYGGSYGVNFASGSSGKVVNAGTVGGAGASAFTAASIRWSAAAPCQSRHDQRTGGTAIAFGTGVERLIVDPGAVFVGNVIGGTGTGATTTLELASAASRGTITGLGTSFVGFTAVTVDRGARWDVTGTNSLAGGTLLTVRGTLTDAGQLALGGSASGAGSVNGAGIVSISANAVLSVAGGFAAHRLDFLAGGHEMAAFGAPTKVSATIAGFAKTDTIDLLGFAATKLVFAGHTLTVDGKGGSVAHLTFAAVFHDEGFHLRSRPPRRYQHRLRLTDAGNRVAG